MHLRLNTHPKCPLVGERCVDERSSGGLRVRRVHVQVASARCDARCDPLELLTKFTQPAIVRTQLCVFLETLAVRVGFAEPLAVTIVKPPEGFLNVAARF